MLGAAVASSFMSAVCGHSQYMALIPNGDRVMGGKWHGLGHIAPSPTQYPDYVLAGFPRNKFGTDFAAAGHQWTVELCQLDSDGDGLTNGQELGDPECTWHVGLPSNVHYNVSHPGLKPKQERVELAKAAMRSLKGWKRNGLTKRAFTAALFYYQFVYIPALIVVALLLSFCVRGMPRVSWLGVFCSYYVLFILGVGCGVHRYFSHKSFVATPAMKVLLGSLSLLVGQGTPVDWAFIHRIHHRLCEHELDYHSPVPNGFWYAHATWLVTEHDHVQRTPRLEQILVPDLVNDPDLATFNRIANHNVAKVGIGWFGFPLLMGLLYFCHGVCCRRALCADEPADDELEGRGDGALVPAVTTVETSKCAARARRLRLLLAASFAFAVYYFYLPVALCWASTAAVNSATHVFGDSPFADAMIQNCRSRNVAFLAFPLLGENWHNNHHAAPASASAWVAWYQFDCVYLTLCVFRGLGLVESITVQQPHRPNLELGPPLPPADFVGWPALLWGCWAVIIAAVFELRRRLHERDERKRAQAFARHAAMASLLHGEA